MKNLSIILLSLSLFSCIPADEVVFEQPTELNGMFYSYDKELKEVAYNSNQVNYLFDGNSITVRDGSFLIYKGTYTIEDNILISESTLVNMVYNEGDEIQIEIEVSADKKTFTVNNSWIWFVSSSDVTGTYKFIYN
jgi:hypothetical protein